MSLLDKLIHTLGTQNAGVPFYEDILKDIKNNIGVLLNARLDDYVGAGDLGILNDMAELGLNSSKLCLMMAKEITRLITKYEKRIRIVSVDYANTLSPWQLSFFIKCTLSDDAFKEYGIEIIFKNNRYCEIV